MSAADFVTLALQLGAMLLCSMACGRLMTMLRQPAVLGEMIGGILLGPTVFGMLAPDLSSALFPSAGPTALARGGLIKVGMLFFLFLVGLEINPADIRRHGFRAIAIGLTGTLVPLACGVAIVYLWPSIWGLEDPAHQLALALFIGTSLANTANPVLARILHDLNVLKDDFGTLLLTATVVDDIVAWGVLVYVMALIQPEVATSSASLVDDLAMVSGCLVAIIALGCWIARPLLRRGASLFGGESGVIAMITLLVLASAAATEWVGLHAFLGPFFLGIAVAPITDERRPAFDAACNMIRQFALGFFAPIYFVSMGLTANFAKDFEPWLVLIIFAVACLSKTISAYAGARIAGVAPRSSWAIGCGMNARGATGIILANIGKENGIISQPVYVALVLMCLATSLMAGPLMKWFLEPSPAPPAEPVPGS